MQETARLLETVDKLQPTTYADAIGGILSVHREVHTAESLLAQLDVSEFQTLDAKLTQLKTEEKAAMDRFGELRTQQGVLKNKIEQLGGKIDSLGERKESAQDAMSDAEQALHAVHAVWPDFSLTHVCNSPTRKRLPIIRSEPRKSARRSKPGSRPKSAMSGVILQHNQKCRPAAVVYAAFNGLFDAALFKNICDLRRELDRIYNILKNNVLVEKHEELRRLKGSFNDAFVSHLCQEIYQSILEGQRQLDKLNKELVNHRFGSDREQFRFAAEWVPEFRNTGGSWRRSCAIRRWARARRCSKPSCRRNRRRCATR